MYTALVIPSLGAIHLRACLKAVAGLDPAPDLKILVLSGTAAMPSQVDGFDVQQHARRLGFAPAVNAGIGALPRNVEAVAVLNDDAIPEPGWLGILGAALENDAELAAVQGTIVDANTSTVDGRGIAFDRWGLPIQIDRGMDSSDDGDARPVDAVSGTACLYRMEAIRQAELPDGGVFDPTFDCYHEDLDLGLRLGRLGWRSAWVSGAPVLHLGSSSGPSMGWRHPWWLLANRWRALAGNLSPRAFLTAMPRLARGELRAVNTLCRGNPRTLPTAAAVAVNLPRLVVGGWRRHTPGPRLGSLPGGQA
jgi:cellulose synthase/poly-beta-1,6-N-acetylglucosamine synthase-like glycosyltransferase